MSEWCTRRRFLAASAGLTTVGLAGCTGNLGQDGQGGEQEETEYPSQTITVVIPFGPGGGYDAYGSMMAFVLNKEVPVDVASSYITGASGRVGTKRVFDSEPNGYMMLTSSMALCDGQIFSDADYDMREFEFLPSAALQNQAIAVSTETNIETWDQYVKAIQNEEVKFYAAGLTSTGAISTVSTGALSGAYEPNKVLDNIVVYDGKGAGIQGMKRGDVHVMGSSYAELLPFVESGDLRVIMVLTTADEPKYQDIVGEDVATLKTENVENAKMIEGLNSSLRFWVVAPETPEDRLSYLRDKTETAIKSDQMKDEAKDLGRPLEFFPWERSEEIVTNYIDGWQDPSLEPLVNEIKNEQ